MDVAAIMYPYAEVNRQELIAAVVGFKAGDLDLARGTRGIGVEQYKDGDCPLQAGGARLGLGWVGQLKLGGVVVAKSRARRQGNGHLNGLPLSGRGVKDWFVKADPFDEVVGRRRVV